MAVDRKGLHSLSFIDRGECHTRHENLFVRSRKHPTTGEPLDRPESKARVLYAEYHGISLIDLEGYSVYYNRPLCSTPGCTHPGHWQVAPRYPDTPMPPWWLDE